MIRHYLAAPACTIAAIAVCAALWSSAAAGHTARSFCVLVPHFKDEYWLSVGYGLEQEAARQNVSLAFYEAGGYRARSRQVEQLRSCADRKVDAILLGAVTSDHPELIAAIAGVARKIPVFGIINELHSEALSGRIGVDWQDMGYAIGHHLGARHPSGSPPKTAVFITGPAAAGWTAPLETGVRAGLFGSAVTIVGVFGADTGLRQQLALVETALEQHPVVDYLIGSAPAIEAAIGVVQNAPQKRSPQLISAYVSHTIKRGLMNGQVLAVSYDDPILQGIMAIRQAITAASPDGYPPTAGPDIMLLTNEDKDLQHIRLSPADYFPAIR